MPRAVQEKKMLCAPPAFQSLHALLEDDLPCRTFRDLRLETGKCESHSILPLHGQRVIITNLLVRVRDSSQLLMVDTRSEALSVALPEVEPEPQLSGVFSSVVQLDTEKKRMRSLKRLLRTLSNYSFPV
jgi:hypothetical protein